MSTTVTVRKGVYEAVLNIHSEVIYESDLDQIKMFVHHHHGVFDYSQKDGDRPGRVFENLPKESP